MQLKEFIQKYKIDPVMFGIKCGIRPSTMYNYLGGYRKPLQKKAEAIERESDGLVTVMELRGKDDRKKRGTMVNTSANS